MKIDFEFGSTIWHNKFRIKTTFSPDALNYPFDLHSITYYIGKESFDINHNILIMTGYQVIY